MNRNKFYKLGLLLLFAFALFRCGGTQVRTPTGDPASPGVAIPALPNATPTEASADAPADLLTANLPTEAAARFDKFLRKELNRQEVAKLEESCKANGQGDPFCSTILRYEELSTHKRRPLPHERPSRIVPVRPKFVNGEAKNWEILRAANINSLLRGLASTRPLDIRKLENLVVEENRCPNNIAIALAATLEDHLPDRITVAQLAKFYQKGAECFETSGPDKEVVLTRAALFNFLQKDYATAEKLLTKSVALENVYLGRAYYWLYRARQEQGNKEGAKLALDALRAKYPFSFHTIVAVIANNQDPGDILAKSYIPNQNRSMQLSSVNSLIEQVEILRRLNYDESSAKVLNWAIQESMEAEPELRLYLAGLKSGPTDYRQKISVMTEVLYRNPNLVSKETLELYFPRVLFPVFEKNHSGLDPLFLLSVARQESAFNPNAVSRARARGLLQLLPATGRRYKRNKLNLFNPDQNVEVGSLYLQDLIRRTNGQIHLALAGYNAGDARIGTWVQRYTTQEPILFIDLIPFRETREYVASVLRNYYWYRRIGVGKEGNLPKSLFDLEVAVRP